MSFKFRTLLTIGLMAWGLNSTANAAFEITITETGVAVPDRDHRRWPLRSGRLR